MVTTEIAQNQGVCRFYLHPGGELSCPDANSALALRSFDCLTLVECKKLAIHYVRLWPILLQKSFWGSERKFLGPLMRFPRGDVRDRIVSFKIDHGPS